MGNRCSAALLDAGVSPTLEQLLRTSGPNGAPNKRFTITEDGPLLCRTSRVTPLCYALLRRDGALVRLLLTHGADPNKPAGFPHRFSIRPLHLAVLLGLSDCTADLLQYGADPSAPLLQYGAAGVSEQPLAMAVADRQRMAATNAARVLPPATVDRLAEGDTPLHLAARVGAAGPAATLLAAPSVDVNGVRHPEGLSPLAVACGRPTAAAGGRHRRGWWRRGASSDGEGPDGGDGDGGDAVLALLLSHPRVDVNAGRPLFAALSAGRPDVLRALLDAGASVVLRDPATGRSLLHHAVLSYAHGTPELCSTASHAVRLLAVAGCDVNEVVALGEPDAAGDGDGDGDRGGDGGGGGRQLTLLDVARAARAPSTVVQAFTAAGAVSTAELLEVLPSLAAPPGADSLAQAGAERGDSLRQSVDGGVDVLSLSHVPVFHALARRGARGSRIRAPRGAGGGQVREPLYRRQLLWYVPLAAVLRSRFRMSLVPLTAVMAAAFLAEEVGVLAVRCWGAATTRWGGAAERSRASGSSAAGSPRHRRGVPGSPRIGRDWRAGSVEGVGGHGPAGLHGECGEHGGLDGLCCVCMSSRAVLGFVHGDVVHCCLCAECEGELRRRGRLDSCLICKQGPAVVARVVVP